MDTFRRVIALAKKGAQLAGASMALALWAAVAHAQGAYPSRPIRIIVPYAPGGTVDVQTRAMTERFATEIGQPVVVEARPGANANIGAELVAKAPADGYTLLVTGPFFINNPLLETGLRWTPSQLAPVGRFSLSPSYFVVPANSAATTVREFVDMARRADPPLQYGDGGTGTTPTMATEMLRITAGIQLQAIPYKGAPPMLPELIKGELAFAAIPSSVAYPQIQAGKIRALANISGNRSAQLPDVPTIAEAGYPDVTALSWYGLHAPAGTPPEVLRKLDEALRQAIDAPDTKSRLVGAGGEVAYMGRTDFADFIKHDADRWKKMIEAIRSSQGRERARP